MRSMMSDDEEYFGQSYVCSLTPVEFEKYCQEILLGYAENENLPNFSIDHNVKLPANDGVYQIDLYATYTALGAEMKVICECKQYKNRVNREKVVVLADKVRSLGAQKGILLSTAGYQSGAIQYAKEHGIALIQIFDTQVNWYSHSAGPTTVTNEDDPFSYSERHMPAFVANLITADPDNPQSVYPTRAMMGKLYAEINELSKKIYGIDIFSDIWKSEEQE